MAKKTRLAAVLDPAADAAIIHLENAPFLKGPEAENLLCGKCGLVICKGVSVESFTSKFGTSELLLRCPKCGTANRAALESGG